MRNSLADSLESFTRWLEPQESRNWKVDVQLTPDHILNSHHLQQYVANYLAGTAISDYRIVSVDDKMVTITKWCYRTEQQMTETMSGEEFVIRFLMHIVPSGCQRLRSHGLFRGQMREAHLDRCHRLIRAMAEDREPIETATSASLAVESSDSDTMACEHEANYRERDIKPPCCRLCGCSAMERVEHRGARQTRQWLDRIRRVIDLYERRWTTLDGPIAAMEREQHRTPSQQLDFDDWHFARMWSKVFTSTLIQSVSNLTLNLTLNDSLMRHDLDAVIVDDGSLSDDWTLTVALTTFTLPLPNW